MDRKLLDLAVLLAGLVALTSCAPHGGPKPQPNLCIVTANDLAQVANELPSFVAEMREVGMLSGIGIPDIRSLYSNPPDTVPRHEPDAPEGPTVHKRLESK